MPQRESETDLNQLKFALFCMDPMSGQLWGEYSFLSFISLQSVVAFRKGAQTLVA